MSAVTIENCLLTLLSEMEEDASEEAPSLFQNSPYYDDDGLIQLCNSKPNIFSLLTLNCQSLNSKYDQLKIYTERMKLSSCNFSAICLQETWLDTGSDVSLLQLEEYNFIHKGKSCSAHGGIAIYLHEHFDCHILDINSSSNIWDGLFIEIYEKNANMAKKLIIGNIYRPPRNNVDNYRNFIDEINEIMSNLQRSRSEIVIVGDFNLDLLKMNSNIHIKEFFECMLSNGFVPKITFPTRLSNRHGSLIDNIFVKLSNDYSEATAGILWENLSDHQPCFTLLDYFNKGINQTKYVKIHQNGSNSINDFINEVSERCQIQNFVTNLQTDPNQNYNILDNILISSLQKHLPVKNVKFDKHKHKKSSWITSGIIKSIKFRDRLYAELQMLDVDDDSYYSKKLNLATYNRILKQNIRLAKKSHYYSCFEKFKDDIKKTWSTINDILNRSKKKKDFPKYFFINGQNISNPNEIAKEFNEYFIKIGSELSNSIVLPQNRSFEEYLSTPVVSSFSFELVDKKTILKAIDNLKPKTSTGMDGLSNKLVKLLKNVISDCLTLIINQSISTGIFPEKLKIAKVIPLFKKGEVSQLSNYRPISILPSLSKIIERIMHSQIQDYFDKFRLFYESQYGFRPEHSTELAALEVVDQILMQMDKNKVPINIYLDLSKAFDCLDHKILLSKLKFYGFADNSLQLMNSYLSNRKQIVRFNDYDSDSRLITTGVPQGSILGPLLFLIYINDISHATSCFRPVIYADDTTLGAVLSDLGSDNVTIEENINKELSNVLLWLKLNKLTLNIQKTKAMAFHTPQRKINVPKIQIDNHVIEYVAEFNYLGIYLDRHLNWKKHLDVIRFKISRVSGIMNKLKHFLPQAVLITLYNSLISPHLNYGVLLWGCKADVLEKAQKKIVRIITLSKYNAHTEPLFKKLNFLRATHLCALHELKFCYRLKHKALPSYFLNSMFLTFSQIHQRNTRHSHLYQLPKIKHSYMKNSLRYRIPNVFNNTAKIITDKIQTHSLAGFKTYIKKYFLNNYSTICSVNNCYICG
jgi:hypothetical protein